MDDHRGPADDRRRLPVATKVAILGKTAAHQLFGERASPIGQTIRIRGIPFTVVGVLGVKGQNALGPGSGRHRA